MTCAVEGESDCDSCSGSLTLHATERVMSVLGTGEDESESRDEAASWLSEAFYHSRLLPFACHPSPTPSTGRCSLSLPRLPTM